MYYCGKCSGKNEVHPTPDEEDFYDHEDLHSMDTYMLPDGTDTVFNFVRTILLSNQTSVHLKGSMLELDSDYGNPLSPEKAAELLPSGEGGLIWHAQLVSDDANGEIKPRRPDLPVRAKDFFSSLIKTLDNRWIFSGVLNGWPALTCLELIHITHTKSKVVGVGEKLVSYWSDKSDAPPTFPTGHKTVRATLRMASWSSRGWSKDSPGTVWWFRAQRSIPLLHHGEDIVLNINQDFNNCKDSSDSMPICTYAHFFSHRYARGNRSETAKELLTYHSAVVLEWDHGKHLTVVELAILNGIGARHGQVNWYHDKLEETTLCYKCMPAAMIAPWQVSGGIVRYSAV